MRRDLRGLSKEGADWVAAHLVAAGALADDEPETAWRHARAARARGGRIGVVRETVGLVAYRAGEWAEAIGELRAARRMGGGPGHLAVMADCERALEHPEKAIELSRSAEADELDPDASIELSIVVAGARSDLGQIAAALAHLERIGLDKAEQHPRLAYAYADLLLKADRGQEALSWFIKSADVDNDEETDALDRVAALSESENVAADAESTASDVEGLLISDLEIADLPLDVEVDPDNGTPTDAVPDPTDEVADDTGKGTVADIEDEIIEDEIIELEDAPFDPEDRGTNVPVDVGIDSPDPVEDETDVAGTAEGSPASTPEPAAQDDAPALLFSDDQQTGDR